MHVLPLLIFKKKDNAKTAYIVLKCDGLNFIVSLIICKILEFSSLFIENVFMGELSKIICEITK